jgi:starch-binding outer membrane protein, SusD/RagB family
MNCDRYFWLFISLFLMIGSACRKLITVPAPTTELVTSSAFKNDQSAESALTGIYSKMMESSTNPFSGGSSAIGPLCGLAADELQNYSSNSTQTQFYENSILASNTFIATSLWGKTYQYIFAVNSALEGISASNTLTPSTRNRLNGEAKFLRAFYYFYLVNLFDSVPLITATDYLSNAQLARAPLGEIYQQIILDLQDAENDFSGTTDQVGSLTPGLSAVHFLQARYYLYQKDWANALKAANDVFNLSIYSISTDLNQIFLKESTETVWQLMPVIASANSWDGFNYILLSRPSNVALSSSLLSSFEAGDQRRSLWVDSITVNGTEYYFPYKYKVKLGAIVKEYQVVFRLSELLLIRAEALAEQENLSAADADLNQLRTRAGLPSINSTDLISFRSALLHERQVELFTEWGQRWFDLKRTDLATGILAPLKGSDWQPTDVWFPIPQSEIQNDPKLTQNAGY